MQFLYSKRKETHNKNGLSVGGSKLSNLVPHYRRNHMWHVTWFICIRTNYDRFKNRKIKNTILYECTVQGLCGLFFDANSYDHNFFFRNSKILHFLATNFEINQYNARVILYEIIRFFFVKPIRNFVRPQIFPDPSSFLNASAEVTS